MLDFGALPPEINSGRMYAGPGAGPMLAAAVAWDALAAELFSTAASYGSVITDLAAGWLGPSSLSMAAAAMPYVSWITTTAGQAEATGAQAKAAVAAYEAAFAMTVPPPVIAANRALLMALIATNFLGINTPAIMATEAHYMEMWAQDASAMYGYAGASQAASTLAPFTPAMLNTNPAGLGGQAGAVAQAAGTGAGTSAQMVSPFTSAMSMPVGTTMSTPLTAASAPNAVPGLASSASSMSSSSATSPLSSLTTLTSSSTTLTSGTSLLSGTGSSASMGTSGFSMIGSAGALMRSVSPAASILGTQFQPLGSTLGGWVGSGTGMFASPGMGSTAVTAGVGRAASLGMLSVPQSWASSAPAFSSVAPTLSGASGVGAAPAVGAGGPGGTLGGMPMLGNAMRGTGAPMAAKPKLGFRPAMVQHPVYAG